MKKIIILLLLLTKVFTSYGQAETTAPSDLRFMVFTDPHYYDPSLGTEGAAFEEYLDNDRKLLKESRELVLEAINMINKSDASFVIIPGDLTKDGSRVSHTEFAKLIERIEDEGRSVYVIPGNHDVSNGEARAFDGDTSNIVESVTPADFAEIHRSFGYGEALFLDQHSLSYVAEPVPGTWFLALDACLYDLNQPGQHPHTDGAFKEQTLKWIREIAAKAREKQKRVIAFMHHGITEHYEGQAKFYGEYVVNNHEEVSALFASLGINVVFTGHYHAQDVTLKTWKNGNFIYDIETGSLVTYPCPVREIDISGTGMQIKSHFLEQIPSHPEGFTTYSRNFVHSGIAGIAERTLISYKLKPEEAALLAGQIADAFLAHYKGDEQAGDQFLDLTGVGLKGRFIILFKKKLIKSLYHDLPPADNNLTINLDGPV